MLNNIRLRHMERISRLLILAAIILILMTVMVQIGIYCGRAMERSEAAAKQGGNMHLKKAMLCMNCEDVGDTPCCQVCGSLVVVPLSRWIPPMDGGAPSDELGKRRDAILRETRSMEQRMSSMMSEIGAEDPTRAWAQHGS